MYLTSAGIHDWTPNTDWRHKPEIIAAFLLFIFCHVGGNMKTFDWTSEASTKVAVKQKLLHAGCV